MRHTEPTDGGARFPRLYLHVFICAACVLPTASYVLSTLGWDPADIGTGTALLGVAGTVSAPFWGRLDDHAGWAPRAAVLATGLAAAATAITLGRLPHLATWAGLALFGAAEGPLDALLTTRILEAGDQAARLGRLRAYGSLGWVLGLALASAVLTLWPDRPELVLCTAALAALTAPRSWGSRAGRPLSAPTPLPAASVVRPVLRVLVFTFPTAAAMAALLQFTGGWAHVVLSAGPFLALMPIALSAALELPAFPLVDRLAHRFSPLLLAVLAGPPLAVAAAALALVPSGLVLVAVQPLVAVSFTLWFVGQSRMLSEAAGPDRRASAQTLGSAISFGGGGLLAGAAGGRLAQAAGYDGMFTVFALVAAAGVLPGIVVMARSPVAARAGARLP